MEGGAFVTFCGGSYFVPKKKEGTNYELCEYTDYERANVAKGNGGRERITNSPDVRMEGSAFRNFLWGFVFRTQEKGGNELRTVRIDGLRRGECCEGE